MRTATLIACTALGVCAGCVSVQDGATGTYTVPTQSAYAPPAYQPPAYSPVVVAPAHQARPGLGIAVAADGFVTAHFAFRTELCLDRRSRKAHVRVSDVDPRGKAARSGLMVGDLIESYNGRWINDTNQLIRQFENSRAYTNGVFMISRSGLTLAPIVVPGDVVTRHERAALSPTQKPERFC